MTDLDEHLLQQYEEPPLDTGGYRLEDDAHAAWALRKLAAYQRELDRIDALADAEHDRVNAWRFETGKPVEAKIEFWRSVLIDFRRQLELDRPDLAKTYSLPGGKLTRRKLPDRVEVTDAEAFIDWALSNDTAAVKMTPQVSALKGTGYVAADGDQLAHLPTGEAVPGVRYVDGEDRYDVKVDRGGDDE